jgi:hypothetical protein
MLSFAEAVKDRRHHFVERQAASRGEFGRIPHLGVDDVVGREVLDALGRHTLDRIGRLEEGNRVPEPLEVELEALPVGSEREPTSELGRVGRRQLAVADVGRKLDHCLGPQPTVEVVVQERLRRLQDRLELEQ